MDAASTANAEPKVSLRQPLTTRAWVPNSATWNGCFADPDTPPGVMDSPFVPERELGEFLCTSCFLIKPINQAAAHSLCADCE
jgi:hypothetical protein